MMSISAWQLRSSSEFLWEEVKRQPENWTLLLKGRGGVADTRLEAKDTKKIRGQGQGQPFREQTLSWPRTRMLEAKAKDQGHNAQVLKKKGLQKRFLSRQRGRMDKGVVFTTTLIVGS